MLRLTCGLVVAALLVGASGCGGKSKKYKLSGTLTKSGKPLEQPGASGPPAAGAFASGIQLEFIPFAEDGTRPTEALKNVFAKVNADGSYEVAGGLPTGKYLVTVKHTPRGPTTDDELKGRFSLARTPITYDHAQDGTFDIDLDKFPSN